MKLRHFTGSMFLALGIIMAVISVPSSLALSREVLDRNVAAYIADDAAAGLQLEGLDGQTYDLSNKFKKIGKIINNTKQDMLCNIIINVDYNMLPNKNCQVGFKILEQEEYAINNGSKTMVFNFILAAGQSYDILALLDRNQNSIFYASFDITAETVDGDYGIKLADSTETPRAITFY